MSSALLRSAAILGSAGSSRSLAVCCFLVSAALVLLSLIRLLLILSASAIHLGAPPALAPHPDVHLVEPAAVAPVPLRFQDANRP